MRELDTSVAVPYVESRSRRAVRLLALAAMVVSAVLIVIVLVAPFRIYIGPLRISLRTSRNPGMVLVSSWVVWYLLARILPDERSRLRAALYALWYPPRLVHRVCLSLAGAQLLLLTNSWLGFADHVFGMHRWTLMQRTEPTFFDGERDYANLEYLAAVCRHEMPPESRILYHGHIEGMVFAYEVYPRKVYMHPADLYEIARSWHKQRWLEGMPDDPLEKFWQQDFPKEFVSPEQFNQDHHITHEVWFDETQPTACVWRTVR